MKKLYARAKKLALNPALKPVEVYALRALVVYAAARLGIYVDHKA